MLAQQDTLKGVVVGYESNPLYSTAVINSHTGEYRITDYNGNFTIPVDSIGKDTLVFIARGYDAYSMVPSKDTVFIQLVLDSIYDSYYRKEEAKDHKTLRLSNFWMGVGGLSMDYSSFDQVLDTTLVNMLDSTDVFLNLGMQFQVNDFDFGLIFGFNARENSNDTILRSVNVLNWGADVGYRVLNTKRLTVRPNLRFHLIRKRLTTENRFPVPLASYLNNRDLDLRTHEYFLMPSLDVQYHFERESSRTYPLSGFSSIGLSGGVVFPLHKYPLLKSRGSSLEHQSSVRYSTYYIEATYTIHISSEF